MTKIPPTTILFPEEYVKHRYSLIHFNFFVNQARVAGVDVKLVPSDDNNIFIHYEHLVWGCVIDGKPVIIDYADHGNREWTRGYPGRPYFKFQKQSHTPNFPMIHALGPPMIGVKKQGTKGATIREYISLLNKYQYRPGTKILCKQLPNGAATERRTLVQDMIQKHFVDTDITADNDQIDFWKLHENCLSAICVPGATNNMVDRGHMELIGLGVCTVSPRLDTMFVGEKLLEPGIHYIICKNDYSDLISILENLAEEPKLAKSIGDNAKKFYLENYSPWAYWNNLKKILSS